MTWPAFYDLSIPRNPPTVKRIKRGEKCPWSGAEGKVTLIHFTAHKACQWAGMCIFSTVDFLVHSTLLSSVRRNVHKDCQDNKINTEAKIIPVLGGEADLMESLFLCPLWPAADTLERRELLGYASQRLPAVLIGTRLRQSISKCPSLWEKQWEIKNTQLSRLEPADGPLSGPKGHCVQI